MIELISDIKSISSAQWESLEKDSPFYSIFQTRHFYEFLMETKYLEPFVVAVKDEVLKGIIVGFIQKDGGLIKQFCSRRAIVNGGPMLCKDCTSEQLETLLHGCSELLKRKSIYVEFRNYFDYSSYKDIFNRCGFNYEPHYDFHLATPDVMTVESQMHQNPKRTIRTSLKNGASIKECSSSEEARKWYEILDELYRERVRTPLFPWPFFAQLVSQDFVKLLLVEHNGEILGGGLYLVDDHTVYEWFICGKDGFVKGVHPSTLGTYAGIQYAALNGKQRFDFMGAGAPGDGGYGVRDFKAKFGGELVEYGRYVKIQNKMLYEMGKIGVKLLKKL